MDAIDTKMSARGSWHSRASGYHVPRDGLFKNGLTRCGSKFLLLARTSTSFALAALLAACSTFRGAPPAPVNASDEAAGLVDLHDAAAIKQCLQKFEVSDKKTCRDTIVQARMVAIDAQYREFRKWFYGEARWGNFGATVVSLGLTGAATLSSVTAPTARLLSAIASGVTGAHSAYDKEVLVDQAANAIENSMDAARATFAVRIRAGMEQPAEKYPLAEALSDLESYYSAGTLNGAFTNIGTLTGVQVQAANKDLNTLARGGALTTAPSGARIRAWLRPNGNDLDQSRVTQLQNWLKADVADPDAPSLPWAQILVDPASPEPSREELRQRAIQGLKIP